MRGAFIALAFSLTAHLGVAAALLSPRHNSEIADPPPSAAGETFELPAPDTQVPPLANASPSPETTPATAPAEEGEVLAPTPPRPPTSHGRTAPRASRATRPSGGRAAATKARREDDDPGGSGSNAQYGAVGERSASDLATAFTRGFPQAASADPAWRGAALGGAGEADVTLTLDGTGRIESSSVTGAPSAALAGGIRRTLALIQGRQFVARGKVTRLHLSAQISADAVHDGLHGDVFAIGGSYLSGEGNAFFALAAGRRIDLRVRAR